MDGQLIASIAGFFVAAAGWNFGVVRHGATWTAPHSHNQELN